MPEKIKTIAWVSHERPDLLKNSVQSLLDNQINSYRFIIAESGRNQSQPKYLNGQNFIYIDDKFRTQLINELERQLIRKGFESGIAKFALDGNRLEGTEGAHRNAINLLTINQNYLSCDDDILFNIKSLSSTNWRNFYSFPDWPSLQALEEKAATLSVNDFILLHETALQKSTFSSPGLRGHSIYGGPRFIFTFSDSSLVELCKDSMFFDKALSSRLLWSEVEQPTTKAYSPVATYNLGMNNKYLLPPCFPFGRNLDGAFVYATKALNPFAQTTQIKPSILHKPSKDRGKYSSLNHLEFRINDIIWLIWADWLSQAPSEAHSVIDRYSLAAKYFQEMSNFDFKNRLKILIDQSMSQRSKILKAQYERLKENSVIKNSNYLSLLEEEIKLCRHFVNSKDLLLPIETEMRGPVSIEKKIQQTQQWIHLYGQMIEAWPSIRSIAHSLFNEETFL